MNRWTRLYPMPIASIKFAVMEYYLQYPIKR